MPDASPSEDKDPENEIVINDPGLYKKDWEIFGGTFPVSVRPTDGFMKKFHGRSFAPAFLPEECRHNARVLRQVLSSAVKVLPPEAGISDNGLDCLAGTIAYLIRTDIILARDVEKNIASLPGHRACDAVLPECLCEEKIRGEILAANTEKIKAYKSEDFGIAEKATVLSPSWELLNYRKRIDEICPEWRARPYAYIPDPWQLPAAFFEEAKALLEHEEEVHRVAAEIYRAMQFALESVKEIYVALSGFH